MGDTQEIHLSVGRGECVCFSGKGEVMRRFSMVVLWGGLIVALGVGMAPAQLNEIFRGAVNDVPTDMFACMDGSMACGLTYRMFSATDPADVNGSANPSDGNPSYRMKAQRYLSDSQTTANFPLASGMPGADWFMLWDGQTGGGTADHAGWYGTQSQVIDFFELGNALKFNCLPVIAQEACFGALDVLNGYNDTVWADGSPLMHVGGISPIPCPTIVENGLSTITFGWEEAVNNSTRDGAPAGVAGYGLSVVPNPLAAPTDGDVGMYGVEVATTAYGTTMATVDRATLGATPGLVGSTIYSANLALDYVYGKESMYTSCNSAATGYATLADEAGDAPFVVDVEQAWYEIRVSEMDGKDYVVVTLDMADLTVSKNLMNYYLRFDGNFDGTPDAEVRIFGWPSGASRSKAGVPVLLRWTATFDAGDIEGNSVIDDETGRVQIVIDAANLAMAVGGNSAHMTGLTQLRSNKDPFDAGVISF